MVAEVFEVVVAVEVINVDFGTVTYALLKSSMTLISQIGVSNISALCMYFFFISNLISSFVI